MTDFKALWYDWLGGNNVLFFAINSIRGEYYDLVMQWLSRLSEPKLLPYYLVAIGIWILLTVLYKLVTRHKGIGYYLSGWVGVAVMLVAGYFVMQLTASWLNKMNPMPRPQLFYQNDVVVDTQKDFKFNELEQHYVVRVYSLDDVNLLEDLKAKDLNNSLISRNVAFMILLVVALWPLMNERAIAIGILLTLLVGWARISVGVHFPADIFFTVIVFVPLLTIMRLILYFLLFRLVRIKC